MVLGLRSKNRKGTFVKVEYLIHIEEIKLWPPSQSLKLPESVWLQWVNGEQNFGSTKVSVLSTGSDSECKIYFNESFRLLVTLSYRSPSKGVEFDTFRKNCLYLNLYEYLGDKFVKGQPLGTFSIDFAEYGVIKDTISINVPMNCKKSNWNTALPVLYMKILPYESESVRSRSRAFLSKEASWDRESKESVSDRMSEEISDDLGIQHFTDDEDDDEASSQSSRTSTIKSPSYTKENIDSQSVKVDAYWAVKSSVKENAVGFDEHSTGKGDSQKVLVKSGNGSAILVNDLIIPVDQNNQDKKSSSQMALENLSGTVSPEMNNAEVKQDKQDRDKTSTVVNFDKSGILDETKVLDNLKNPDQSLGTFEQLHGTGNAECRVSKEASLPTLENEAEGYHVDGYSSNCANTFEKMHCRVDAECYISEETCGSASECNTQDLLRKVEKLEAELRETAAIEIALYSVVADHGSSVHKVHTPARRLSRMYMHAYRSGLAEKRSSAARNILSGLSLVAKSSGNDVSRLTYWLSNSVVFRTIILEGFSHSDAHNSTRMQHINTNGTGKRFSKQASTLVLLETIEQKKEDSLVDLQDPETFAVAVEKIELWIFNQIIKSIWWQILTVYMQYPTKETNVQQRKSVRKMLSLTRDLNRNNSVNLWKKAFQDVYERLCPARSGGHECGCLSMLAKMVMEQCVSRLDVAMFNAIMRESDYDIPTDPISDPISGSEVLPVSCGSLSFGAGAELKTAVGTWSICLSDLLKIDDSEVHNQDHFEKPNPKPFHLLNALSDLLMLPKDMLLDASIRKEVCPTFPAPLIKQILGRIVPDEFCPETVPEAILAALDSETESDYQSIGDSARMCSYPCNAPPVEYSPPSTSLISGIIGDVQGHIKLKKNTSMVLRKGHISDDELDELDSPLPSIIGSTTVRLKAENGQESEERMSTDDGENFVRYHLLREVWVEGD